MRYNAKELVYEKVKVLGKEGLFTSERVDRDSVPDGWFMYEVRHDDNSWGDPIEIGLGICVNFFGTLLMKEPLLLLVPSTDINNAYLDIDSEKDWKYLYDNMVKLEES